MQQSTAEGFDDYFPCRRKRCNLTHVKNWLQLFVDSHNKELEIIKGKAYVSIVK